VLRQDGGAPQPVPVMQTLAPRGGSQSVTLAAPANPPPLAYTRYSIPTADPASLAEINSFVEDIHTNVVFLNLVDYARHGLKRLDIETRIKSMPDSYTVSFVEGQRIGDRDFILPLTTFLTNRVLQFQVSKTYASGQTEIKPWQDWDLTTAGNVVSIIWPLIQP
jgi:hypothetical protein